MNSNIAILLARLDSSRLPGKHFMKIGEKTLIDICLDRLLKGNNYQVVLATSDRETDKPLVSWAKEKGIAFYAGHASDLRKRIKGCVAQFQADYFARVNADSPFADAALLDKAFDLCYTGHFDLVTNLFPRSFPYGYSVEVFRSKTFLETIEKNPELENVTSYFYQHADLFKIHNICNLDGDFSTIKLTVDTPEDLQYLKSLYNKNHDLFSLELKDLLSKTKN
jgi:spore coat polysaccharide biosynthesis protein SpsF